MADYERLVSLVMEGQSNAVGGAVQELLDEGIRPKEIIESGIGEALRIVGQQFSAGDCFIPEMMIAARASQKALDVLKPLLIGQDAEPVGKAVIGTVQGDLHDIGKNVVAMMLRSAGFETMDLGVDTSAGQFVAAIREIKPEIVCLSCLLTPTSNSMGEIIEEIERQHLRGAVTIMIGGPPTSPEFAKEIGADYYGENAYVGAQLAREIIAKA